MPMAASDIERLIREAIPDAEVTIRDLAGDGDHYAARVVSASFDPDPALRTMLEASIALDELPDIATVAREAQTKRERRLRVFRRFDEY